MKYQETESVELKRILNDSFEKEVVAFLNTHDGIIYIGIDDNGNIVGVDQVDKVMKNIADIITDKILPNAQELIYPVAKYVDGKMIIEVSVKKGTALYYIKKYGRSASGCFVRIGTSSRGMTDEQIEKCMLKAINFHKSKLVEIESRRQDLTFEQFKYLLSFRGVHVNDSAFNENFCLKTKNGVFNEMAFLLSDQNDTSIKVVRFRGTTKSEFISRKEFGFCCLIKAMVDALEYSLNVLNIIQTNIVSALRVDTPYFDEASFREAWINAICHHDWSQGTPPAIYGFDDRVEIISHGKLKDDLTEDEFFKGVSKPVNDELAKILTQMHYIEQSGRGIPTIVKKYGKSAFHFGTSYIECIIPYNILDKNKSDEMNGDASVNANVNASVNLSKIQVDILNAFRKNKTITLKEIANLLSKNESTIVRNVKILKEKGILVRNGSDKTGHWEIKNSIKNMLL